MQPRWGSEWRERLGRSCLPMFHIESPPNHQCPATAPRVLSAQCQSPLPAPLAPALPPPFARRASPPGAVAGARSAPAFAAPLALTPPAFPAARRGRDAAAAASPPRTPAARNGRARRGTRGGRLG
eukprot:5406354-Pleurochrysis_carterae.AAC.1